MGDVVGNAVLCAAFIAYCGFYDQGYRAQLVASWRTYLKTLGLAFTANLSIVEYLSSPDERFQWRANKLTADEIAEENAVILGGYNRYPLVIDPSGQATEFLMAQFAERKISKTSFLAPTFLKDLEAALRFGTALLVEDVESIDPVLNPVLNRGTLPFPSLSPSFSFLSLSLSLSLTLVLFLFVFLFLLLLLLLLLLLFLYVLLLLLFLLFFFYFFSSFL
jgi:hypothetical protein